MSEKQEMYPDSQAFKQWEHNGCMCYLVRQDTMGYYHCGYVRFTKKPVKEDSYNGILTYVPVHGGITYAHWSDYGMVYGFDCAHSGDENNPDVRAISWLTDQCHLMADGIALAAEFEDRYLLATGDNAERAAIVTEFHEKLGAEDDMTNNFGAMLNVLCGRL